VFWALIAIQGCTWAGASEMCVGYFGPVWRRTGCIATGQLKIGAAISLEWRKSWNQGLILDYLYIMALQVT
jgi:hypothetical protein